MKELLNSDLMFVLLVVGSIAVLVLKNMSDNRNLRIKESGIREWVRRTYCQHGMYSVWECIEVIEDDRTKEVGSGPFGSHSRHVLLECNGQRLKFVYHNPDIVVGTKVYLSLRNPDAPFGVCMAGINEYAVPVPLIQTNS